MPSGPSTSLTEKLLRKRKPRSKLLKWRKSGLLNFKDIYFIRGKVCLHSDDCPAVRIDQKKSVAEQRKWLARSRPFSFLKTDSWCVAVWPCHFRIRLLDID